MNKVTLSVVALAAIGAPVQSQAADQTEAEKLQATYDEVCGILNTAINEVNGYHEAVKAEYLNKLSNIQKEIDAAKTAGTIDKAYFAGKIDTVKADALIRENQYVAKDKIDAAFKALTVDYNNALKQVKKGSYPNVGANKKAWLEGELGYSELKATVEALDPATQNDIAANKAGIVSECTAMQNSIKSMLAGIDEEEKNVANNEAAYNQVVAEIKDLKNTYNEQLQELLKLLPGDPDIYGDWQAKAIDELNEQYRQILDVEKKNNAAHEAGNANGILTENQNTLYKVSGEIGEISKSWSTAKQAEENAYTARKADVETLKTTLKSTTDKLSQRKLSDLDSDISTINAKIGELASTIEDNYKAHTVSKLNISKSKAAINKLISELEKKAEPIIANYDANAGIITELEAQYKTLEAAKKAADKLSDDGNYKASDYFTESYNNINTKRKAIIDAAKNALDTKTSVAYKASTKYKNAMDEVDDLISTYKIDTDASLKAYNQAAKKITDAQALVDKYAKLADLTVTTDGKVKGAKNETYQEVKEKAEEQIGAIKTQITTAKAKKDAAHKSEMEKAADLSVRGDLQTYLDKYDNNKAEFDKNSAIAAADNILAEADARIKDFSDRIDEAKKGDLGNMKDEVEAKIAALQPDLKKLKADVDAAKDSYNKYNKEEDKDKKAEEAQKTISKLSDVNKVLDELEPKVVEAENLAIKAKNNKAAYDATTKAVTDSSIDGKLASARTEIEKKTTGDGQMFYLKELAKIENSVTALNDAIKKSYTDKKSAENKESHLNTLNNLLSAISTLQTNAIANETMHSAQVEKAKTLQSDWQKAYTNISEKDESTQAKDYLAQLGTLQDAINALNTNIAEAFKTGTSKAKDSEFAAEITRITNEINNIVKAQEEGYNAAITADNIAQHNKFISQYNAAYKMYQDAVAALNEFAKIQNPVLVKALEDLVPTHDAIYAYADKLRLLNADESADYATYKAPKLYSSATWVDKADLYEAEIDAKLKEYQDAVNKIALDNYTDEIKAAVKKLADAKDAIKDYTYKDKKNAFADVDAFVGDAQTAAGLTGKEVDRMFATKIDGWLSQFKNVDNMIDADKEAAADNEFTYQHTNFTNLYNSEKAEIAKLANLTQDYLAQLAKRKQSSINYAYDMFVYRVVASGKPLPAEKKFVRLPDCLKELKKYYAENGTPVVVDKKNHSDIYNKAVDESKYNTANLEAYDAIIAIIDGVSDKGSVGAEAIDPLFNVHVAGSKIYGEYSSILEDIEDFYKDAETWKGNGSCVANKTTAENRAKNIEKAINDIKIPAIDAEIPALRGEIDRVKEEYNKAATQSAELLEKVKVYDAQIQTLYNTLDATPTKENPNNKGINYKWENERSKYGFDAAKADLVKLQSEISRVGRELTALYDAAAQETALAELNARAEELEALLKDFTEKAEYHKDINDKYGADLDDFKAYLEGVKADVEAKNAAGDILFHKNNLLADFDRAEAEFSDVAGLNAMYNKYVTNDKVYNTLKAGFEALQKQLDDLKTLADGFHASHIVTIPVPGTSESVEVEYRNNQYEVISATIETKLNGFAKSHDAINLTDKALEGATDDVSASIVEYEKTIKYDEARHCWLTDLSQSIYKADADFNANISASNVKYGGNRELELRNRINDLRNAYWNAYWYNENASIYGLIWRDIDGNDVRVENESTGVKEAIKIDYIKEAWPTLEAKINTLRAEAEQLAKDVNELAYIEGDADNDKKVTVNDYSTVRNWILSATAYEDVSESQRYAGDVDGNKQFTVADMTKISNIIFYGDKNGAAPAGAKGQLTVVDNDEITLVKESEETSVFGKTIRVAVNVAHNVAFTAGQFDVKLPEGMKIASQSLTERGNGHELLCNEIGNGLYRMVAATIDNTKFNGRTGALVLIDVEVSGSYTGGEISVSNVIFSDANGISYSIVGPGNDGETTGIDGVTAPTVKERIYSIGGQMKKALKKGINIIVGEDGKGHKVVK